LLSYRWEESPQGPPRKYYALTPQGEEYLKQLEEGWDKLVKTVNAIRSNDK
jgi:PadR family transcriptional regulator PadR